MTVNQAEQKVFGRKKPFLEIVARVLQKGKFFKCKKFACFLALSYSLGQKLHNQFHTFLAYHHNKHQKLMSSDCFKQILQIQNVKSFRLLQCFWPIESESA